MELNDVTMIEKFIIVRWAYSVGVELIPNEEYTVLLNAVADLYPNSPYVHQSWSSDPCPVALLKKIGREDLINHVILSDKTESIPSLNSHMEVQRELGTVSCDATMSMKHDGWNIQASYFNKELVVIQTRGRATDAVDVSKLRDLVPQSIPEDGKIKVVMEATISKENFQFCKKTFGNVSPRSSVSTIFARPEYYNLLSLHAVDVHGIDLKGRCKFEVFHSWGFDVPAYIKVNTYDDVMSALGELSNLEPEYAWPTDGAVYDGELCRAIRLGAWEEPVYKSYVTGYSEKFSAYRINPSIEIFPIVRKGATQYQINMTNWQRIIENDLRPNSPVAFRIASSAIADIDLNVTRMLQKQWEGRYEDYMAMIKESEEQAECYRRTMQYSCNN